MFVGSAVSRLPFGIGEPQLRARVRSFGCGRSARAMTHIPVGQSDRSISPVSSVTHAPSRGARRRHRLVSTPIAGSSPVLRPRLAAPLDLAQNLVDSAVEYARTLGFDPATDFAATRDHLGPWSGQGAITFGRDGKPFFIFIQGPHDNPTSIVSRQRRSVGPDDFEYLIGG